MATLRLMRRSRIEEVPAGEFLARMGGGPVLVDLGAGDAKYPYRIAKENPGIFCVGIEPSEESLKEISKKVGAKRSRGGVDNLALVVCPVETIPGELSGVADRLTVNYPWGTLLRWVCVPEAGAVAVLSRMLKPGGTLDMVFNMQVFEDAALRARLALPDFNEEYARAVLAPAYAGRGIIVDEIVSLEAGEMPERTSWGGRLCVGSARRSLRVSGRKIL